MDVSPVEADDAFFIFFRTGGSEMHNINDMVLYGADGVCRILDISIMDIGGEEKEYYVLKPLNETNVTVYVPTENDSRTSKMRRILLPEEILELIREIKAAETEWIENESLRKQRYREVLAEGDRRALVHMIKAVYQHKEERKKAGKKLHLSDERFLKDAEKLLCQEFAYVLNITPDEVVPFIMEQISGTENVC